MPGPLQAGSPHPLSDTLRIVLFVVGAQTVAVAAVVLIAYFAAYRRTQVRDWRGLLPHHVLMVSISYLALFGLAMWDVIGHLRTPLRVGFFAIYAVSFIAGAWAMWDVLGHERRRFVDLAEVEEQESSTRP